MIPDREDWYKTAGQDAIRDHLYGFYREPPAGGRPSHISVYALGPIPLLIQFGASLTNKDTHRFLSNTVELIRGNGVTVRNGRVCPHEAKRWN